MSCIILEVSYSRTLQTLPYYGQPALSLCVLLKKFDFHRGFGNIEVSVTRCWPVHLRVFFLDQFSDVQWLLRQTQLMVCQWCCTRTGIHPSVMSWKGKKYKFCGCINSQAVSRPFKSPHDKRSLKRKICTHTRHNVSLVNLPDMRNWNRTVRSLGDRSLRGSMDCAHRGPEKRGNDLFVTASSLMCECGLV